jgi:hypothetical protein
VEAYTDSSVADVRKTANANSGSGISNAQVFRLTSGAPTVSGLTFYINENVLAPNDQADATLAFTSGTISTSNPLRVTLSTSSDLASLSASTFTLTATRNSSTSTWTAPAFSFSGTSSAVAIDLAALGVSDGTYSLTALLTDSTYGTITKSSSVTIALSSSLSGNSTSAGGGCSFYNRDLGKNDFRMSLFLVSLVCIVVFFMRRHFFRTYR